MLLGGLEQCLNNKVKNPKAAPGTDQLRDKELMLSLMMFEA